MLTKLRTGNIEISSPAFSETNNIVSNKNLYIHTSKTVDINRQNTLMTLKDRVLQSNLTSIGSVIAAITNVMRTHGFNENIIAVIPNESVNEFETGYFELVIRDNEDQPIKYRMLLDPDLICGTPDGYIKGFSIYLNRNDVGPNYRMVIKDNNEKIKSPYKGFNMITPSLFHRIEDNQNASMIYARLNNQTMSYETIFSTFYVDSSMYPEASDVKQFLLRLDDICASMISSISKLEYSAKIRDIHNLSALQDMQKHLNQINISLDMVSITSDLGEEFISWPGLPVDITEATGGTIYIDESNVPCAINPYASTDLLDKILTNMKEFTPLELLSSKLSGSFSVTDKLDFQKMLQKNDTVISLISNLQKDIASLEQAKSTFLGVSDVTENELMMVENSLKQIDRINGQIMKMLTTKAINSDNQSSAYILLNELSNVNLVTPILKNRVLLQGTMFLTPSVIREELLDSAPCVVITESFGKTFGLQDVTRKASFSIKVESRGTCGKKKSETQWFGPYDVVKIEDLNLKLNQAISPIFSRLNLSEAEERKMQVLTNSISEINTQINAILDRHNNYMRAQRMIVLCNTEIHSRISLEKYLRSYLEISALKWSKITLAPEQAQLVNKLFSFNQNIDKLNSLNAYKIDVEAVKGERITQALNIDDLLPQEKLNERVIGTSLISTESVSLMAIDTIYKPLNTTVLSIPYTLLSWVLLIKNKINDLEILVHNRNYTHPVLREMLGIVHKDLDGITLETIAPERCDRFKSNANPDGTINIKWLTNKLETNVTDPTYNISLKAFKLVGLSNDCDMQLQAETTIKYGTEIDKLKQKIGRDGLSSLQNITDDELFKNHHMDYNYLIEYEIKNNSRVSGTLSFTDNNETPYVKQKLVMEPCLGYNNSAKCQSCPRRERYDVHFNVYFDDFKNKTLKRIYVSGLTWVDQLLAENNYTGIFETGRVDNKYWLNKARSADREIITQLVEGRRTDYELNGLIVNIKNALSQTLESISISKEQLVGNEISVTGDMFKTIIKLDDGDFSSLRSDDQLSVDIEISETQLRRWLADDIPELTVEDVAQKAFYTSAGIFTINSILETRKIGRDEFDRIFSIMSGSDTNFVEFLNQMSNGETNVSVKGQLIANYNHLPANNEPLNYPSNITSAIRNITNSAGTVKYVKILKEVLRNFVISHVYSGKNYAGLSAQMYELGSDALIPNLAQKNYAIYVPLIKPVSNTKVNIDNIKMSPKVFTSANTKLINGVLLEPKALGVSRDESTGQITGIYYNVDYIISIMIKRLHTSSEMFEASNDLAVIKIPSSNTNKNEHSYIVLLLRAKNNG